MRARQITGVAGARRPQSNQALKSSTAKGSWYRWFSKHANTVLPHEVPLLRISLVVVGQTDLRIRDTDMLLVTQRSYCSEAPYRLACALPVQLCSAHPRLKWIPI